MSLLGLVDIVICPTVVYRLAQFTAELQQGLTGF